MKRIIKLSCFVMLISLSASAQHINRSHLKKAVTICSLVNEGNSGTEPETAPLVLYMKDSATSQNIDIVFTQATRKSMSYDPYSKLVNQTVCVTGRITRYNNVPAIIIHSENQIKTSDKPQVSRISSNH